MIEIFNNQNILFSLLDFCGEKVLREAQHSLSYFCYSEKAVGRFYFRSHQQDITSITFLFVLPQQCPTIPTFLLDEALSKVKEVHDLQVVLGPKVVLPMLAAVADNVFNRGGYEGADVN